MILNTFKRVFVFIILFSLLFVRCSGPTFVPANGSSWKHAWLYINDFENQFCTITEDETQIKSIKIEVYSCNSSTGAAMTLLRTFNRSSNSIKDVHPVDGVAVAIEVPRDGDYLFKTHVVLHCNACCFTDGNCVQDDKANPNFKGVSAPKNNSGTIVTPPGLKLTFTEFIDYEGCLCDC